MRSRTYHRIHTIEFSILLRLLLLLLILSADVSFSKIRYVSKTGSSEAPYLTWETASDSIQKCINICRNGDTVVVANGVYKEYLVIDSVLTLLGSSMDSTIIDGTGLDRMTIYVNNNLTFENFTVNGRGISDGDYNYTFFDQSSSDVRNCRMRNANIGMGISRSSGVIESVILENVYYGVYTFCITDTCKPTVQNCLILVREDENWPDIFGIRINLGGRLTASNNIILGKNGQIGIGAGLEAHEMIIKNNLIAGFRQNIDADAIWDSVIIMNNVLRDQKTLFNYDGALIYPSDRAVIKNNIFVNNEKAVYFGSKTPSIDYNLYWKNDIINNKNIYAESDIFADPMFVRDTMAHSMEYDYHLQAFSPAIDAGDPSILDKDGSRSDIGMFGGPGGESYTYQNFAPKPPANIKTSMKADTLKIIWDKASESDHSHFNIYTSANSEFNPDSGSFAQRTDTNSVKLALPKNEDKVYYLITSLDSAGNESIPGELISVIITDAGEAETETIREYRLYQNYPNPFNPATTIPFRLKAAGFVKIVVYDIKGELIRTVLNDEREEGYHEIRFNSAGLPSGLYLYKIEITGSGRIPVYSEMRKMLILK